ncbi:MAG: hypothetical protein AAGF95_24760 [Chloroflexota bacterium]
MCRKMFIAVVCLIILVLGGCGTQATTTPPTQTTDTTNSTPTELPNSETVLVETQPIDATTEQIQTDTFEGVIFNEQMAQESSVQFLLNNVDGFWTPTQDDVLQLEDDLSAYLQQNAEPEHARIWQELTDYERQYVGIVQDEQEKIHASFFCDGLIDTSMSIVGGDDCYFQVIYNVEEDLFSYLNVHSES